MPCPPSREEKALIQLNATRSVTQQLRRGLEDEYPDFRALLERLGPSTPGVREARAHLARPASARPSLASAALEDEERLAAWELDQARDAMAGLCAARCALFRAHPHQVERPADPAWTRERDRHHAHRLEDLAGALRLVQARASHWEALLHGDAAHAGEPLEYLRAIEARWSACRDDLIRLLTHADPFGDELP